MQGTFPRSITLSGITVRAAVVRSSRKQSHQKSEERALPAGGYRRDGEQHVSCNSVGLYRGTSSGPAETCAGPPCSRCLPRTYDTTEPTHAKASNNCLLLVPNTVRQFTAQWCIPGGGGAVRVAEVCLHQSADAPMACTAYVACAASCIQTVRAQCARIYYLCQKESSLQAVHKKLKCCSSASLCMWNSMYDVTAARARVKLQLAAS